MLKMVILSLSKHQGTSANQACCSIRSSFTRVEVSKMGRRNGDFGGQCCEPRPSHWQGKWWTRNISTARLQNLYTEQYNKVPKIAYPPSRVRTRRWPSQRLDCMERSLNSDGKPGVSMDSTAAPQPAVRRKLHSKWPEI